MIRTLRSTLEMVKETGRGRARGTVVEKAARRPPVPCGRLASYRPPDEDAQSSAL